MPPSGRGDRAALARGPERGRRARDRDRPGQAVHGLLALSPQAGSACPRRDVLGAPRALPPLPSRLAKGRIPSLAALGLEQEVSEPAPGGERRGAAGARPLPRRPDPRLHRRPRRARPRQHLAPLPLPALRLPLGPGDRGAAAARQGPGGVSAPALLARLPPPRPAPLPAQRAVGVPGSLPRHDQVELRPRPFEAWCEGRTGYPLVDAGHAPAAARGLDAQPRPARGRLVSDQGPGHRLALGRALVHAPADRRRRGQQQRQLAVDRLGRHRSAARVPADLQPGPPPGALRPRQRLRAPLRARARARSRRGTCASRGRCPRRSSARPAA